MIAGIGTDLCEICRIEKSLNSPAFRRNVFGEEERAFLEGLSDRKRPESAAANFAAKEAFLKALGKGLGDLPLGDIQTLRRDSGEPYFALTGRAQAALQKKGLTAHLSLGHEAGLALAFVILERAAD